jgi:hypothetical protein
MPIWSGGLKTPPMLGVYAGAELVYQLTGANLSSPQTAELNARARAATITKWVVATHAKSAFWVTTLCVLDGSVWPLIGGGLAVVDMHFSYRYAIRSGLRNPGPGTENYAQGGYG